jgi:hypothetical protein
MALIPRHTFTRDWEGRTAVVIGNGPSMLDQRWPNELARAQRLGAHLMVANGGYRTFPFADVLMCSDRHWLAANADLSDFAGDMIVVTRPEAVVKVDPRMVHVKREFIERMRPGLDIFRDPGLLVEGHTSTSTNISAAIVRGASRIILVGIDLSPGADMRRRLYDESVDTAEAAASRYGKQVRHLTAQSVWVKHRRVEVLNASPRSALECYSYVKWEDVNWR